MQTPLGLAQPALVRIDADVQTSSTHILLGGVSSDCVRSSTCLPACLPASFVTAPTPPLALMPSSPFRDIGLSANACQSHFAFPFVACRISHFLVFPVALRRQTKHWGGSWDTSWEDLLANKTAMNLLRGASAPQAPTPAPGKRGGCVDGS
jgi:hypothetical protein